MQQLKSRKRRFGDRYDGYKVKESDPLFYVIPHIMRSRLDSQVFFREQIEITQIREFVQKYRKEIPNLSLYHVFIAAVLRTMAQKPRLNRFVSGRKIYARNYLRVSLAIKKGMNENAPESLVMPEFEPTDTLYDVAQKFNEEIEKTKTEQETNGTEFTVKLLNILPGFMTKFVVWVIRNLDAIGKMPKIIHRVSPFHSSFFVTNVGSIGLNSIYHHLYEFGTTSVFLAIGKKEVVRVLDSDGNVIDKNVINLSFVLDERICDGFYYASAIKNVKRLLKKPELLLEPPEYISEDY